MDEPLSPEDAKRRLLSIREEGQIVFSRHAREEMAKDQLSAVDVDNVLRGGVVDHPEYENGSWRYRVRTARIVVVVAFRTDAELIVVTVWRVED